MSNFATIFCDEAVENLSQTEALWPLSLEVFQSAALRASGRSLNFVSRRKAYVELLKKQIKHQSYQLKDERQVLRLSWFERDSLEQIREEIRLFLAEMTALPPHDWRAVQAVERSPLNPSELNHRVVACILQTLYLATGSLSEPQDNYHLEFSFPRILACTAYHNFLMDLGLGFKVLDRSSSRVLYLKGGEELSEFLLRSGCFGSYLAFEQLRVDKEMKNQVNRVVNCDSANASRLANASARQDLDIRFIEATVGLESLPEKLEEAARIRLKHPGLSLEELGRLMDPPIGKSGMNHRMKKLRDLAEDLRK